MLFAQLDPLVISLALMTTPQSPCATTGQAFTGTANTPIFEHRWAGIVVDVFTTDGQKAWTVEDGARIRATTNGDFSTASATFQSTPLEVKDMLHRVFFLSGGSRGWAVGEGGWVLGTVNGGTTWLTLWRENDSNQVGGKAVLFDVHFLDAANGWLVGLHQLKYTTNGGTSWSNATLLESDGVTPLDPCTLEIYAIDFLQEGDDFVGLAVAEPGKFLRTTSDAADGFGTIWTVVHDTCVTPLTSIPPGLSPCTTDPHFEPWDVEFVPGTSIDDAEAIVVGGIGHPFGYVLIGSSQPGAPVTSWQEEYHECPTTGTCTLGTGPACNFDPTGAGRLTSLNTLYGVAVNADRSAFAVGYAGQHVWRDTGVTPHVWRDRSQRAANPFEQGKPTQPMNGAGGNGSGIGWVVGYFNSIRAVSNNGECYTNQTRSLQYRLQDVYASSSTTAWHLGQFSRIAKTTNGGATWTQQTVTPVNTNAPKLFALTFDGSQAKGVAVGQVSSVSGKCAVLATTNGGADGWSVTGTLPSQATGRHLHEVDFDGTSEFWAAGSDSLVLRTTNIAGTWTFDSPQATGSGLTLHGVSFSAPGRGFVCGESNGAGVVWRYDSSQSSVWTNVTPSSPATVVLMDVAADADHAYAVGLKHVGTDDLGVVLEWKLVSGTMQFVEVTSSVVQLPYCIADGELEEAATHTYAGLNGREGAILNEVEIVPGTDEVFVGGDCGRMLHKSGGTWSEIKSQTSQHVYGMSFPSSSTGFVCAFARGGSGILRYIP
jgi:photosystem II stability/assembly factor-like uncharacterized protein